MSLRRSAFALGSVAGHRAYRGGALTVANSLPVIFTNISVGSDVASYNTRTTGPFDTTRANLLIVVASWFRFTTANVTVSDSKSNTWTQLVRQNSANYFACSISYVFNPTVGVDHTFTVAGTSTQPLLCVAAVVTTSGSPADVFGGAAGTSAGGNATLQPGSITPSQDNCLVVTGLVGDIYGTSGSGLTGVNGPAINSGFTQLSSSSQVSYGGGMGTLAQATAAAVNPTWSFYDGAGQTAAVIGAFKL